jgi:hypothetical protein
MSTFRVSGVWKDSNYVITHYAFHTVTTTGTTRASKKTKAEAIALLETTGNNATTWVWNYKTAGWSEGETIEVINDRDGKYLRSDRDNKLTNNLGHLIDYDWIKQ